MERKKQEILLFQEMSFNGSDKIMILNKPRLLEVIDTVCKNESLASLRESDYELGEI